MIRQSDYIPKGPSHSNNILRSSYTMDPYHGFGEYMKIIYFGPKGMGTSQC